MIYRAINRRTGRLIAGRVRVAQDLKSRHVGLLNRGSMGVDEGLLIKPCNSIHTFFMKFGIDVVFLSRQGMVVKIAKNIKPFRLESCHIKGYMTLELTGGVLKEFDIKIGDYIDFVV